MLDVFNFPTPQQSNFQEFYGGTISQNTIRTWVKPRGASMVRFMLIGAGGGGGNGSGTSGGGGGGSGAITSWIGPALFIPDILNIRVGSGGVGNTAGDPSLIYYRSSNGENLLLRANGGGGGGTTAGGSAGNPMSRNQFTASGIFTSLQGQNGAAGGSTGAGSSVALTNIFLSGGAGGSGSATGSGGGISVNYGYPNITVTAIGGTTAAKDGYFLTQPILVGCGGAGGSTNATGLGSGGGRGGIGCGGGGSGEDASSGGRGGDGAVFIWAW